MTAVGLMAAPLARRGEALDSIVCAGSFVRGHFPDFAVLDGRPARVVGDSRQADDKLLALHPELRALHAAWSR